MIPAAKALTLPTAKLTTEEVEAADMLEAEIEAKVRQFMERRGLEIKVAETRGNVIAEVNQRLKAAGYSPQWQTLVEQHKLNAAVNKHVGFQLSLAPSDEAYRVAARAALP